MGLPMEQRVVNPTTRKWADARSIRNSMLKKVASYQPSAPVSAELPMRNLAARLWRAVRHEAAPAVAADVVISNWAEAELGIAIDSHTKLAQFRYAVQQLGLGVRLLQPLTAEQKQAVLAAMPLPLPVETPVAMPEQELASMFDGLRRLLHLPIFSRA